MFSLEDGPRAVLTSTVREYDKENQDGYTTLGGYISMLVRVPVL